jgi:hypothetical protein
MYDDTQRTLWLDQLKTELARAFGFDDNGERITVSYPSAGARGALERVRPADYDEQWRSETGEKIGSYQIHPIAMRTPMDAAKAALWAMARFHHGVRHGQSKVGLHKEPDATITADAETEAKLQSILNQIGEPPKGFGEPFPVKKVQRTRMVTYVCRCAGGKVYATSAKRQMTCQVCSHQFTQV